MIVWKVTYNTIYVIYVGKALSFRDVIMTSSKNEKSYNLRRFLSYIDFSSVIRIWTVIFRKDDFKNV